MVTITRGDVVLCDLNPVVGTEQAGVRPIAILQIDRANAASPRTIIAPFTTQICHSTLPSHVFVPAGNGGLSQDSVLLCEQVRVIDKRRIRRVLGHLDDLCARYAHCTSRMVARAISLRCWLVSRQGSSRFMGGDAMPHNNYAIIVGAPLVGARNARQCPHCPIMPALPRIARIVGQRLYMAIMAFVVRQCPTLWVTTRVAPTIIGRCSHCIVPPLIPPVGG